MSVTLTILSFGILVGLTAYGYWLFKHKHKIIGIITMLIAIAWWPFFEYYRPHAEKAMITGTDVIRNDDIKRGNNSRSRDIRLIYTTDNEFANEDNLFWLKWDSGTVTNKARQYENKEVTIIYDGMRFKFLSWYPNLLSINPGFFMWSIFWVNYVFFLLPYLLIVYIVRRYIV